MGTICMHNSLHRTGTLSIVAYDPDSGRIGAATASCVLGVGGRVVHYRSAVGIVLTQHVDSPAVAEGALSLMQTGLDPQNAVARVLATDPDAGQRQLLAVDFSGRLGLHSGEQCAVVCAEAREGHVAAAGNCLTSRQIPEMMLEAYRRTPGQSLSARLLAALSKAAELKGDSRGLESAALLSPPRRIADWRSQIVNLRVDHAADPISELVRLYDLFDRRFGSQ